MTNTTTELLAGLRQSENRGAWGEFDRRYRPILIAFIRRMGLNENDAADVAQDTLACFVQDYRRNRYDREQGRLRSWLIGIARCRLADLRRATGRRRELRGESAIEGLSDQCDADLIWETEQRRFMFQQAIGELRETTRFNVRTIEAFEGIVLRGEAVDSVAQRTGLTAQEIYNAKNRVVEKLREIVSRYEESFVAQ
jgi:RNA polymerase sigma-70 factor (ECF subfamily)